MDVFVTQEELLAVSNKIIARGQHLQNVGHGRGSVFAASGHRRSRHMLMDWALIEVRPEKTPAQNYVITIVLIPFYVRTFY